MRVRWPVSVLMVAFGYVCRRLTLAVRICKDVDNSRNNLGTPLHAFER
jgi:hypothetical protein